MLKATLLKAAASPTLKRQVTSNPVAWRVARRFIAGSHLDDAEQTIRELNGAGMSVALDHLGENTESEGQARAATAAYLAALDRIQEERLDANISVKLTALGLWSRTSTSTAPSSWSRRSRTPTTTSASASSPTSTAPTTTSSG